MNKEKLIAVLTDALQGCVDELVLHERMAFQNDDADLIDRLNAAREALKQANEYQDADILQAENAVFNKYLKNK